MLLHDDFYAGEIIAPHSVMISEGWAITSSAYAFMLDMFMVNRLNNTL